ncbi:hypothetical protein DICPUDRAFT_85507 [Dictyostelium purpureum]|uniref:Uncharacterized protein n=1 Tax=Dictyostelium purpureum TaxID=5786 RepID=F1A5Y3_DICPU|nr:uncharacterized protein DICPUDRAFT_85507 [Dictyostelium purpureum]EGC28399.1 hypothetical protein DICPUDRAFT_85507 [Dictyostelium purpureum]|eukprot:XP_003295078.1 hypothetical protein DICPUDRAFT_85507 [Dictyostelium purpureum]
MFRKQQIIHNKIMFMVIIKYAITISKIFYYSSMFEGLSAPYPAHKISEQIQVIEVGSFYYFIHLSSYLENGSKLTKMFERYWLSRINYSQSGKLSFNSKRKQLHLGQCNTDQVKKETQ